VLTLGALHTNPFISFVVIPALWLFKHREWRLFLNIFLVNTDFKQQRFFCSGLN